MRPLLHACAAGGRDCWRPSGLASRGLVLLLLDDYDKMCR